jgi:D-hexose-6-phosphate mutarotase
MSTQLEMLAELNERHGRGESLSFAAGPGGLITATIRNAAAEATVCLMGGHVMAYQPRGERPVIWMSPNAVFEVGKPIRGGIPVCWPWFGAHPARAELPSHGCVRTRMWSVAEARALSDESTMLRLTLADDAETRAAYPHAFELNLRVVVGRDLRVELETCNTGSGTLAYSAALHTYFAVSDISGIEVNGLDGARYIDTVGGASRRDVQHGPIRFAAETDAIFLDTEATCTIEDPAWARRIAVAKTGSRSTVVWNPWTAKAARLTDLGEAHFAPFVCVETANCLEDVITVPSGSSRRLGMRVALAGGPDRE